jgi:hypothetical protein
LFSFVLFNSFVPTGKPLTAGIGTVWVEGEVVDAEAE